MLGGQPIAVRGQTPDYFRMVRPRLANPGLGPAAVWVRSTDHGKILRLAP